MKRLALVLVLLATAAQAQQPGMVSSRIWVPPCGPGETHELAWMRPSPIGNHRATPPGPLTGAQSTPLFQAELEFVQAYGCRLGQACYRLALDVNVNSQIDPNDFKILVARWTADPRVVGNRSIIRIAQRPDARGCLVLTYLPTYFNPLTDLYASCVQSDGQRVRLWVNGPEWAGPASRVGNANRCP